MNNFWQYLSGNNTVHRVDSQYNQQSSKSSTQVAPELLFSFDETSSDYGDSLQLSQKPVTTKPKTSKSTSKKAIDKEYTLTIGGKKIKGKILDEENGNTSFLGKSEDGSTTYLIKNNSQGELILNYIEKKNNDGSVTQEKFTKTDTQEQIQRGTKDKDGDWIESSCETKYGDGSIAESQNFKRNKDGSVTTEKTKKINGEEKTEKCTKDEDGNIVESSSTIKKVDGTVELSETKNTEDGSVTTKKSKNEKGEITASRTEYVYTDGTTEAEFYEKHDGYYVEGTDYTYLDENGEKKYKYESVFKDNYGNLQSIMTGDADESTELREDIIEKYSSGPIYTVQEKLIQRGEGTGLARVCGVKLDNENEILDYSTDSIELTNDKKERQTMTTDKLQAMTSVSLSDREISESEQFSQTPEIKSPTHTTDVKDIIANGGEVTYEYSDGTTVTEFYRVSDGKITKGYTTTDTETGIVIDDYKETYDESTQRLLEKEQIKYDDATAKHVGRKETFQTPDGITTIPESSYYIQGEIGDTLRYTSGSYDENGKFTPDYSEDTVDFNQLGKTYSVSSLQEILSFEHEFEKSV